jgi:hypothetical protein
MAYEFPFFGWICCCCWTTGRASQLSASRSHACAIRQCHLKGRLSAMAEDYARAGRASGGEKLAEWQIKAPRVRGWRKRPGPPI